MHKGTQGDDQLEWLKRGILQEANIQAALPWLLIQAQEGDRETAENALRICGDLCLYWHFRGKTSVQEIRSKPSLALSLVIDIAWENAWHCVRPVYIPGL